MEKPDEGVVVRIAQRARHDGRRRRRHRRRRRRSRRPRLPLRLPLRLRLSRPLSRLLAPPSRLRPVPCEVQEGALSLLSRKGSLAAVGLYGRRYRGGANLSQSTQFLAGPARAGGVPGFLITRSPSNSSCLWGSRLVALPATGVFRFPSPDTANKGSLSCFRRRGTQWPSRPSWGGSPPPGR